MPNIKLLLQMKPLLHINLLLHIKLRNVPFMKYELARNRIIFTKFIFCVLTAPVWLCYILWQNPDVDDILLAPVQLVYHQVSIVQNYQTKLYASWIYITRFVWHNVYQINILHIQSQYFLHCHVKFVHKVMFKSIKQKCGLHISQQNRRVVKIYSSTPDFVWWGIKGWKCVQKVEKIPYDGANLYFYIS